MSKNDVITLSSDEDETSSPKKRLKLNSAAFIAGTFSEKKEAAPSTSKPEGEPYIILSDDDDTEIRENRGIDVPEVTTKNREEILLVENGVREHDQSDINKLFKDFLNKCLENIKIAEHRTVVDAKLLCMQDAFEKYLQLTGDYISFQRNLEFNLENVANNPKRALIYFTDIYQLLKSNLRDVTQAKQALVSKEKHIKKLERVLAKLKKRIDKLDELDCNWEDEENSTYLQVARYKQRAAEIHAKLCKYRKVNPYSGRITHQRLKFSESRYPEINEAINSKYKNNTIFPTYHEVMKIIKTCMSNNAHLAMSDIEVQIEAKRCFERLGNSIQGQRKLELYSLHSDLLIDTLDDPAKDNPALQGRLLESYQTKVEQETRLFEKYSEMQQKGIKCDDSEEASVANSDSDNNENNGNEVNELKTVECITID